MSIIIMGGTGAGKSTVAHVLSQMTGYPVCEIGHVVKRMYRSSLELELRQLYTKEAAVQEKIDALVKAHSKDFFTKRRLQYTGDMVRIHGADFFIHRLLQEWGNQELIIVGVRTNQEILRIRAQKKFAYFVALTCATDHLINRFVERESRFMEQSVARAIFDKRYESERDRGLSKVMIECDLLLETDNLSPEQLAEYICKGYIRFLRQKLSGE